MFAISLMVVTQSTVAPVSHLTLNSIFLFFLIFFWENWINMAHCRHIHVHSIWQESSLFHRTLLLISSTLCLHRQIHSQNWTEEIIPLVKLPCVPTVGSSQRHTVKVTVFICCRKWCIKDKRCGKKVLVNVWAYTHSNQTCRQSTVG